MADQPWADNQFPMTKFSNSLKIENWPFIENCELKIENSFCVPDRNRTYIQSLGVSCSIH